MAGQVPMLAGLSLGLAERMLDFAGLTAQTEFGWLESGTAPPATVVAQIPAAGTELSPSTKTLLRVVARVMA